MRLRTLQIQPDDGQSVKDGWQVHRQRDFRGCETQAELPEAVSRNQLLRMENVILFNTGYLSAMFQLDVPILTGANPGVCLSLIYGGYYNVYFASGDGTVKVSSLDTSSRTPLDVTAGVSHSVAGAYISGAVKPVLFLGKEYCLNPNPDTASNGILNLTDLALITIPGKTCKRLSVYANRLWVVNTDGTIQISDNGDAATWDPLNITWLPNQEPALDFIPVQGGAIVYGATSAYAMYGSSYTDITFVPLQLGKLFTGGNAEFNGTVYILSTEGIYAATLNGANLLPHTQHAYLQSIFPILTASPGNITAVHLHKFHAILFTWNVIYGGTQSLIYYYTSNGYSKANIVMPSACPYALAMNDINTDFLFGMQAGVFSKSMYPSNDLQLPRISTLQTRHEDADSTRQKIWREFGITVRDNAFGVTIEAILDYSPISIVIVSGAILQPGDNIFNLNNAEGLASGTNFPRSSTISFLITINNGTSITMMLADDTNMNYLIDESNGKILVFDSAPGTFIIQEMKLKYCLAGPDV